MRDFIEDHPVLSGVLCLGLGIFIMTGMYAWAVCPADAELTSACRVIVQSVAPTYIVICGIIFMTIVLFGIIRVFRDKY